MERAFAALAISAALYAFSSATADEHSLPSLHCQPTTMPVPATCQRIAGNQTGAVTAGTNQQTYRNYRSGIRDCIRDMWRRVAGLAWVLGSLSLSPEALA